MSSSKKIERWVFTEKELQEPSACQRADEFVVYSSLLGMPDAILVKRNGQATNRYADGTVGVTEEDQLIADGLEEYLSLNGDHADNWRDVETNDEGYFLRFVVVT